MASAFRPWAAILILIAPLIDSYPFDTSDAKFEALKQDIHRLKDTHPVPEIPEVWEKIKDDEIIRDPDHYDFIVIGSGASGSVVANRLSEVPEWNVLLLEAGKEESPAVAIPAHWRIAKNSEFNWGYRTEPEEKACLGLPEKRCPISRGKALGGTTVISDLVYTRGNHLDYDKWAELQNDGWKYEDVLPYFKKSEDANLDHFDTKFHNKGGYQNVENVPHETSLLEGFLEAGKELGLHQVDYNGKEQLGIGKLQATTEKGRRQTAASAFVLPAQYRKNLKIHTGSQVVKILFGEHTNEVHGVQYVKDGKKHNAKATKEVVVAAGPFNSPQILLLSGVGPKEELEHLGIPPISDHKVGHNLQDHLRYTLGFTLNDSVALDPAHVTTPETLDKWFKHGKGPLTSTGIEALAFIKTHVSKEAKDYPDIELIFNSLSKPFQGHPTFTITVQLLHPISVGSVSLKSHNPFHYPKIVGNHLTDAEDEDLNTLVAGIKHAIKIAKTSALEKYGVDLVKPHGCEHHEADEFWKCEVRFKAVPANHQVGTCKMGPETDKDAVVDHELKVYGVKGLRVADSSVIPHSLSAHTTAAVELLIGEKAGDLIKKAWK